MHLGRSICRVGRRWFELDGGEIGGGVMSDECRIQDDTMHAVLFQQRASALLGGKIERCFPWKPSMHTWYSRSEMLINSTETLELGQNGSLQVCCYSQDQFNSSSCKTKNHERSEIMSITSSYYGIRGLCR